MDFVPQAEVTGGQEELTGPQAELACPQEELTSPQLALLLDMGAPLSFHWRAGATDGDGLSKLPSTISLFMLISSVGASKYWSYSDETRLLVAGALFDCIVAGAEYCGEPLWLRINGRSQTLMSQELVAQGGSEFLYA